MTQLYKLYKTFSSERPSFEKCHRLEEAVRKSGALGLDDLAAAALSQLAKAQTALGQSEDRM